MSQIYDEKAVARMMNVKGQNKEFKAVLEGLQQSRIIEPGKREGTYVLSSVRLAFNAMIEIGHLHHQLVVLTDEVERLKAQFESDSEDRKRKT